MSLCRAPAPGLSRAGAIWRKIAEAEAQYLIPHSTFEMSRLTSALTIAAGTGGGFCGRSMSLLFIIVIRPGISPFVLLVLMHRVRPPVFGISLKHVFVMLFQ